MLVKKLAHSKGSQIGPTKSKMFGTVNSRIGKKKSRLSLFILGGDALQVANKEITIRDTVREMRKGES